jgi:hypothetical protein
MKKTFFYLFAVLFLGSLFLASCEPNPDVDSNKDQTEQPKDSTDVIPDEPKDTTGNDDEPIVLPAGTIRLQALNSEYSTGADMGYSSAVSHSFLLMFATEECEVVMGQPFGTGEIVVLELCSESADDLLPAEGTYKIGDEIKDGCIVAGFDFDGTPIGTYTRKLVDDELVESACIVDGAVEIKKGSKDGEMEFFIYAIFEDSKEAYYYYKGELLIEEITAGM